MKKYQIKTFDDPIVAALNYMDGILVFTQNAMWALYEEETVMESWVEKRWKKEDPEKPPEEK